MNAEMSDAEALHFAAKLHRSLHDGSWTRRSRRQLRRQLRLRTRVRLVFTAASNKTGIWLCDHGMWRVAAVLWRIRV